MTTFNYIDIKKLGFHRVTYKDDKFFDRHGYSRFDLQHKVKSDAFYAAVIWKPETLTAHFLRQQSHDSNIESVIITNINQIKSLIK